ncbi:MAG: hypothetical protein U5M53_02290 [Rhodoferax sp.]|nr:hypothetical protein [Rhodoferax sp.]
MPQHPISALPSPEAVGQASGLKSATFSDDEQAAALTGWNQPCLQLSGGGFRGAIQRGTSGPVRLFKEGLGSTVYQTVNSPAVLALVFLYSTTAVAFFLWRPIGSQRTAYVSGQSGFEFRTGSDHCMGLERPDAEPTPHHWGHSALARNEAGLRATDSWPWTDCGR